MKSVLPQVFAAFPENERRQILREHLPELLRTEVTIDHFKALPEGHWLRKLIEPPVVYEVVPMKVTP